MPRHNEFTNSEMRDMIVVYVQEHFSGRAAKISYQQLYPNRRQPCHTLFAALFNRLGDIGSFKAKPRNGRYAQRRVRDEENVLEVIDENPEISIRRLSAVTGIGRGTVATILHEQQLQCFHFYPVQNLLEPDRPLRLAFCERFLQLHNRDHTLLGAVLFTDEAVFTRRGVYNWKNSHIWCQENPHATKAHHFQHEISVNVWCGIIGNFILGPVALPARLDGQNYLQFLQEELPVLLEDVPLNIRQKMWYMHDGAPPHYSYLVREHLNQQFPQRWIGRGSDFPWPSRCPDLNPLDFYFWGHLKQVVYGNAPPNNREELWQRIQAAIKQIRRNYNSFPILQNFMKRIRKCIEENGGHVEHLL